MPSTARLGGGRTRTSRPRPATSPLEIDDLQRLALRRLTQVGLNDESSEV